MESVNYSFNIKGVIAALYPFVHFINLRASGAPLVKVYIGI